MRYLSLIVLSLLLISCHEISQKQIELVDSLNQEAYRIRYSDIDSTRAIASKAFTCAGDYGDGKARALNLLGYVEYQQMNFARAFAKLDSVALYTNNQIILLCSDVMRMKVNQRIGRGKEYFEARISAQKRMKRVEDEYNQLSDVDKADYYYAKTEFHIISSTYCFYQDQEQQAIAEMQAIADDFEVVCDSTQWLYYHYMMGSGGLITGEKKDVAIQEFDHLMICFGMSTVSGVTYFQANSLQALASLLSDKEVYEWIKENNSPMFQFLLNEHHDWLPHDTICAESHLSEALALHSMYAFRQYKDLFQTACAYRTLGEMSFKNGQYELALENYNMSLDCVNEQYVYNNLPACFESDEPLHLLSLYDQENVGHSSIELEWIDADSIYTVPEWIAGIRQQISMAYSALGMVEESDYNRDIYLDIVARTCQNFEMEGRKVELQQEADSLRMRLIATTLVFILLVVLIVYYARRLRRNNEQRLQELKRAESQNNQKVIEQDAQHLETVQDEAEETEEQILIFKQKIDTNKRRNAEKRAKVSLVHAVTPFLDRIINQNDRMNREGEIDKEKLQYIIELTDRIVTYNDILTDWIKMEKGELAMQISTIHLNKIFQTLQRGHYAYDQKGVELDVRPTDLVVKADEALTLFMLNTLADNARKFTPEGGRVTVKAEGFDDYVELSVEDTGCGMSAEDVDTLNNNKVYDSRKIGATQEGKGFGFGIMNCRGVIEKYRKTSSFFQQCCFGVESKLGEGSRFYFRLPRVLSIIVLLFGVTTVHAAQSEVEDEQMYAVCDSAEYEEVIQSAMLELKEMCPNLVLTSEEEALQAAACNEVELFLRGDSLDYPYAIDLRNEIARSALALKQWDVYNYNNTLCTSLYKLYHQDHNLPTYCEKLQQTQSTSRQLLVLLVLFSIMVILLCLILLRKRMYLGKGLQLQQQLCVQIEEKDKDCLADDISALQEVANHLLQLVYEGMNKWQHVNGIALILKRQDGTELMRLTAGECEGEPSDIRLNVPSVELSIYSGASMAQDELNQQVFNTLARVLNSRVVQIAEVIERKEQLKDELNYMRYEENRLHVQNQVLDNCLSTIKHESMYYPARIQQLAQRVMERQNDEAASYDVKDDLLQLHELSHYYKDVYSLLSNQAEKLTSQIYFRKEKLQLQHVFMQARRHFGRLAGKMNLDCCLEIEEGTDLTVMADAVLMEELMVRFNISILKRYAELPEGQGTTQIKLSAEKNGGYVKVCYHLPRLIMDEAVTHSLFYPESGHVNLLIAKQIVREMDALNNFPGLRLVAESADTFTELWFTVSK